jgi:hypothetical protein
MLGLYWLNVNFQETASNQAQPNKYSNTPIYRIGTYILHSTVTPQEPFDVKYAEDLVTMSSIENRTNTLRYMFQ